MNYRIVIFLKIHTVKDVWPHGHRIDQCTSETTKDNKTETSSKLTQVFI